MCMNSYNALGYGYYMYNLLKTTFVFVCFLWQFLARKAVNDQKDLILLLFLFNLLLIP
jgi:hypothetical protein